MRTAAIIENGTVVNLIVLAEGQQGEEALEVLKAIETTGQDVRIGDLYNGANFEHVQTPEEIAAIEFYNEIMARRKELAEKLQLTEEEASILLGL